MTNEELLTDLKQWVDSRLSQEVAQLTKDIQTVERHLATRIDSLDAKLDEVQDCYRRNLITSH